MDWLIEFLMTRRKIHFMIEKSDEKEFSTEPVKEETELQDRSRRIFLWITEFYVENNLT